MIWQHLCRPGIRCSWTTGLISRQTTRFQVPQERIIGFHPGSSANRTLLPSATVRPRPDRTPSASPRVAAFRCIGGSITPHWVAELIAFSSLMLCAPNLIPYVGFLFRCYSDPLKSFPNLSDPIEQSG